MSQVVAFFATTAAGCSLVSNLQSKWNLCENCTSSRRDSKILTNETNTTSGIISKVWSFCHTLRDDGVGYGDYLEQLTYLLFLKMADEFSKPPYNRKLPIPKEYVWESLTSKRGAELEGHYTTLLRELSRTKGFLGQIFTKSQNKIQDPAKLFKLIDLIDKEQWTVMGADVKGKIYEGLLEKNAEDIKSGAGTVFYPTGLDQDHGCLCPAPAHENHCRPCLRHGRFLPGGL